MQAAAADKMDVDEGESAKAEEEKKGEDAQVCHAMH